MLVLHPLITTKGLAFNDDIVYGDLLIPEKQVTFISGESGTGKSTLLKLMNGTLTAGEGNIFINGVNILNINTIELRRKVLLVSQEVFLFSGSIKENFDKYYEYRELEPPSEDKISRFLKCCCVPFSHNKDCTILSGGERQRVYLAIFLSFLPQVIMLDEPTSALDSRTAHQVIENVMEFTKANEITLIIISHDQSIVDKYAEKNIKLVKR